MSSSSRRERSLARGQVEPIAAIAAVFAIAAGFALYAGVAGQIHPTSDGTNAEATMQRLGDRGLADGALPAPPAVNTTALARPGEAANVTVTAGDRRWSSGPIPPDETDVARRPVTIRRGPGDLVAGWLVLEVWET